MLVLFDWEICCSCAYNIVRTPRWQKDEDEPGSPLRWGKEYQDSFLVCSPKARVILHIERIFQVENYVQVYTKSTWSWGQVLSGFATRVHWERLRSYFHLIVCCLSNLLASINLSLLHNAQFQLKVSCLKTHRLSEESTLSPASSLTAELFYWERRDIDPDYGIELSRSRLGPMQELWLTI
jgi:hypothetical protein